MSVLDEVGRFEVETWPDGARVILALRGELDIASVASVQEALDELTAAGWTSIVLDARELTFIDSMGLSLLLRADRTARRTGGAFSVVGGSAALERLLSVVRLRRHFARAEVLPS